MEHAMSYINEKNNDSDKGSNTHILDFSKFNTGGGDIYISPDDKDVPDKPKSKKSKKTKTKKLPNGTEYIPVDDSESDDSGITQYQSNVPYESTYEDTKNLLKHAIGQIDVLSTELKTDLDAIRASKVLKKKYDYIPEISSTLGTLMSTKITAIKEINKTITDSHNLDIKRAKEFKLNTDEKGDDDKFIMDTYNAFIGMGDMAQGMSVPMSEMVHMGPTQGGINMVRSNVGDSEEGFNEYTANLNPMQNRMRYEQDPNVKTVVVYDQTTGAKYFDVMNVQTGESINNIQRPDPMFLEDTTIDTTTCIARNTNLDETYPVILLENGVAKNY